MYEQNRNCPSLCQGRKSRKERCPEQQPVPGGPERGAAAAHGADDLHAGCLLYQRYIQQGVREACIPGDRGGERGDFPVPERLRKRELGHMDPQRRHLCPGREAAGQQSGSEFALLRDADGIPVHPDTPVRQGGHIPHDEHPAGNLQGGRSAASAPC